MAHRSAVAWIGLLGAVALAGCGGGGEDIPPAVNQPPVATIAAPAAGALFSAGQTLTFSGTATDAADGALATSSLTWWVELHHDAHTHPFQPETPGGSGTVTIPTRGETAETVFYRFHLRAIDRGGASTTTTRDVLPRKARVTLATQPAGLQLTLDGQPVYAPHGFTGVVGMERDLGAADQALSGRRYRFVSWSNGGSALHTQSTPAADTTLTATFVDIGPANNQPPTVSLSAAATASTGVVLPLGATAADADGRIVRVGFFEDGTLLGEDTTAPYAWAWTPTAAGIRRLTAQATDDRGATTTSTAVSVNVSQPAADAQPPVVTSGSPVNLATGLTGTITFSVNASDNVGVTQVEFQADGVPLNTVSGASPYSATVDTMAFASGQHVLRARARDAAGNVSAWTSATVQFGGSRSQPAGITRNEGWVTGLSAATAFAQAPDGRLFVTQQGGALRVVKNGTLVNATLLATPFLSVTVDPAGERGLLGVAFHPNFTSNGFVYVYYTTPAGGTHNRISRFTASSANPDVAQAGSEQILVDLPMLSGATNHNGGALHFGVDGKLYVGVGDNADSATAPSLTSPFGKLLRFNDDGSIPADNPHAATQTGLARAIWARGLRNPFTFAVQPGTGRIHINDVGQNTWEEINLGAPGADYGWPDSEGPDNITGTRSAPLFAYKHSAATPAGSGPGGFFTGFAIAGGTFYPADGRLPAPWKGAYFFADYVSRFIGAIDLINGNGNAAYAFGSVGDNPVDLLAAADGALLVLTRSGIVRFGVP